MNAGVLCAVQVRRGDAGTGSAWSRLMREAREERWGPSIQRDRILTVSTGAWRSSHSWGWMRVGGGTADSARAGARSRLEQRLRVLQPAVLFAGGPAGGRAMPAPKEHRHVSLVTSKPENVWGSHF